MDIAKFKQLPLLGILRGIEANIVEPLVEAIVASGLKTIEITMNTADATGIIRRTVKAANDRLVVGAGTVLTMDDLYSALDAGASFIVLPVLVPEVVRYCAQNSIPVFPGAFTPQEVYNAWLAGATMVKVFPAGFLGPKYLAELKGPFNNIELLACGGVNPDTIGMFFSSGASAAAFGAGTFRKTWLEQGDFLSISRSIEVLISKIPN